MEITFVRHGETSWNVEEKLQGQTNEIELTKKGIEQIEEIKKKLSNCKYDVIISSPLKRAIQTTKIIKPNQSIIIDSRLSERGYGQLEGKNKLDKKYDIKELWNYELNYKDYEVEPIKAFFDRVYNFLDELIEHDYNKVLIVAHSGVAIALRTYFEKIELNLSLLDLAIKNGQVLVYNTNDFKNV